MRGRSDSERLVPECTLLTMSIEKTVWHSMRGMRFAVRETARAGDPERGSSTIVQAQGFATTRTLYIVR